VWLEYRGRRGLFVLTLGLTLGRYGLIRALGDIWEWRRRCELVRPGLCTRFEIGSEIRRILMIESLVFKVHSLTGSPWIF
jgi:hypothetical protein